MDFFLSECSQSCGFKLCSEKCQTLYKRHNANECQYAKKINDKSADQWLTVLRILLIRQEDPELFENFMLLEDHLQDRKDCPIMKNNKSAVFDVLKRYVPELLEGLNTEDIFRICGILDANSFRMDKNGSRGLFLGKYRCAFIYGKAEHINFPKNSNKPLTNFSVKTQCHNFPEKLE